MPTASPTNKRPKVCPWWVAYTFDNPLRRLVHPPEKILQKYVREGMQVLDIGCGFGHFAIGMARLVGETGRVTALDVQNQMLAKTLSRARKQGLDRRMRTVCCNNGDWGLEPGFDFALASNVLHEAPDLSALITQVAAVLKPGGLFYIMEPYGHVREAAFEQELDTCREAGFLELDRPRVARERCALLQKPARQGRA